MSLDYPYYEELKRRGHPAARWWVIGDGLYFLSLLMGAIGAGGSVAALVVGLTGWGWDWVLVGVGLLVAAAFVFVFGMTCKGHAYDIGGRDGISAAEVYRRAGSPAE